RQREVETAGRPAGLAHHRDESGQVVVTLRWVDDYVSCHNDHEILLVVGCCSKQDDLNLREAREASLDTLTPDADASSVYGEPYEIADGATVIPVTKVLGLKAKPIGVFVIKDGKASWQPAV